MADKATETKITWTKLEPAMLDGELKVLFNKLTAARKAAGDAQKAFADHFLKGQKAPDGKEFRLSFKFGIAIALVPLERKSVSSAGTLADWLKQQAA